MQITKTIQKKNPLTKEELENLFDKMVEARKIISEAKQDLDARKDAFKDLSESQNAIIDDCFADYARGYSVELISCTVSYEGKIASYYDAVTGEKVEGEVLEEGDQLEMTGGGNGREDAESYLRRKSKEDEG